LNDKNIFAIFAANLYNAHFLPYLLNAFILLEKMQCLN